MNPDPQDPISDPEDPAMGADTLVGVLREAEAAGHTTRFTARSDAVVTCEACGSALEPGLIEVSRVRRLEGASDAADLLLVAWCTCPTCAAAGVLTLGYGPNSSEADLAVLPLLEIRDATTAPVSTETTERDRSDT